MEPPAHTRAGVRGQEVPLHSNPTGCSLLRFPLDVADVTVAEVSRSATIDYLSDDGRALGGGRRFRPATST
ncbi:MAG: hypothetical protein CSA58_01635 [Micrococcales bacterium]|nr:MAG: hypothetical protein CSA58_01635 [Micrococcales bacterium]